MHIIIIIIIIVNIICALIIVFCICALHDSIMIELIALITDTSRNPTQQPAMAMEQELQMVVNLQRTTYGLPAACILPAFGLHPAPLARAVRSAGSKALCATILSVWQSL